jgi:hypothetical protein
MFLYLIKKILYPKIPNIFIIKVIQIISKPFYYFIVYIKTIKYINPYIRKIQYKFIDKLKEITLEVNIMYIYIFQIIPRTVMVLIFITDVFYLHYIQVFYYFIILTILPWIYIFMIYFIRLTLEDLVQWLEGNYSFILMIDEATENPYSDRFHADKGLYDNEIVPIRQFINIQFEHYISDENHETVIEYYGIPIKKDINYLTDDIANLEYDDLKEFLQKIVYKIVRIKYFLQINNEAEKSNLILKIKIIILIGYLICWIYILIISFDSLKEIPITMFLINILENYAKIHDPFSQLPLDENLITRDYEG